MEFSRPEISGVYPRDALRQRQSVHTYVEVAVLDRTQKSGMYLYEVKRSLLDSLNTPFSTADLKSDSFVLLGEVKTIYKERRQMELLDGTSITYSHLVVVFGSNAPIPTFYQTEEFSAGLHTLSDALRVRGKIPDAFAKNNLNKAARLSQVNPASFFDYAVKFQAPEIERVAHPHLSNANDQDAISVRSLFRRLCEIQL